MRRLLYALIIILGVAVVAAVLMPIYAGGGPSPRTSCLSNIKQLCLASLMYCSDYDDKLPTYAWMDQDKPYYKTESILHEPIWKNDQKLNYGYAFNSLFLGANTKKIPTQEKVPLIYDSSSIARNCADPFASLPSPARHGDMNNVGYLDGHVKALKQ